VPIRPLTLNGTEQTAREDFLRADFFTPSPSACGRNVPRLG